MLLEVKDLHVAYGKAEVIKGVSLSVEPGTISAIVGPNGAGKTTLLRCISGLISLSSGEIWYQGQRIDGMKPDGICKLGIGHVLEGKRLFPHMQVFENLLVGGYLEKSGSMRAKKLREVYDYYPILQERNKQQAKNLSGGEQQMLAISCSLMAPLRLLLVDEPSIGLAPLVVRQVVKSLVRMSELGISVLLVEQNVRMAFQIAHKGYILEGGRIVLEGRPQDLAGDERVKKHYLGG